MKRVIGVSALVVLVTCLAPLSAVLLGQQSAANSAPQTMAMLEAVSLDVVSWGWEIGFAGDQGDDAIAEFVRPGETVENWTELVTMQSFMKLPSRNLRLDVLMDGLRSQMAQRCPDVVWDVLESSEREVLYEWRIRDCAPHPDQHEIALLFENQTTVFRVAYSARGGDISEETKTRWLERLQGLSTQWTLTFQAPPPPEHTSGVEFTLEEVGRSENNGSTRVDYQPTASGFPQGLYRLWIVPSFGTPNLVPNIDFSPDASGEMVMRVSLFVTQYHKGEPYELQLRSSDETVHAFVKVFPFPILAEQDGCRVWVEFLKDDFKEVAIWGDGFDPGANLTLTTQDGRDDRAQQFTVPPNGRFSRDVKHRDRGGEGSLRAVSSSCTVTLTYDHGRQAEVYQ